MTRKDDVTVTAISNGFLFDIYGWLSGRLQLSKNIERLMLVLIPGGADAKPG